MNYNNHYAVTSQGFMSKVYGWMTAGLAVTAGVAYYLSPTVNPKLFMMLSPYILVLAFVQFGLGMYFSMSWKSLSYESLAICFVIYSGLMGVTLAPVAYAFTGESIFQVFIIAACMFGVMAVYGSVTRADLSSIENILFMGLIGLLVANFINIFWHNAQFDMMVSAVGVGLFTLLVAFDVQKLRSIGAYAEIYDDARNKVALLGALTLYLDVINLFVYLLRLFGKRREN
jgi:FtsH-binding integral membrane protein